MNIERLNPSRMERANRAAIDSRGQMTPNEFAALSLGNFGRLPKHQNPIVSGLLDVINQPMYDSVSFAAAAAMAKTTLFQTPIGQSGKTLAQTNMTKAGQLEQPQKLVIRSIRLYLANNTNPTDLQNFLSNVSFVLTIGKKPFLEVPAVFLSAGCGGIAYAAAELGTVAAGDVPFASTSNGVPDPRSTFTLDQPI
ncbi:MAG: hypothetical protein ACREMY_20340, partial [bacterium]